MGSPPTLTQPTSFIWIVSTLATMPEYSVEIIRYEPSALKSMWSAPGQGMATALISFHVCGSRNSIRCRRSTTSMALVPSGVK